jgi:hypothetical protein
MHIVYVTVIPADTSHFCKMTLTSLHFSFLGDEFSFIYSLRRRAAILMSCALLAHTNPGLSSDGERWRLSHHHEGRFLWSDSGGYIFVIIIEAPL